MLDFEGKDYFWSKGTGQRAWVWLGKRYKLLWSAQQMTEKSAIYIFFYLTASYFDKQPIWDGLKILVG